MTTQEEAYVRGQLEQMLPDLDGTDEQWHEWRDSLYTHCHRFCKHVDDPLEWVLEEYIDPITLVHSWHWRKRR